MMMCCGVDLVPVALSGLASLALGSVFFKAGMCCSCPEKGQMGTPCASVNPVAYIMEFINSAVRAWALFAILNVIDEPVLQTNLYYGFLISLAGSIPAAFCHYIWKGECLHRTFVKATFEVALIMAFVAIRSYFVS